MVGRLWATLKSEIRYFITPAARQRDAIAEAERAAIRGGLVVAGDIAERQRIALERAWDTLGFRFTEEVVLSLEIQFLWGVFREVIRNAPALPTNGHERIRLHLMAFLMKARGKTMESAGLHARGAQALLDEADILFGAIEQKGRLAYRDGGDQHLVDIVLAVHKSGTAGPEAYVAAAGAAS
jgi:hypothetical protein